MLLLTVLCILLSVLLLGSYIAYRRVFFSPMKGREILPDFGASQYDDDREKILSLCGRLIDRPCEYVTILSQDGLTLSGRYYHVQDGAPLDIGFHGYRSSPMTDFSGGSILSFDAGHNLLLVDQRAHGKSQGHTIAFGIQERWDAVSWVEYALARFGPDVKIVLYGISMGAATVLMASGLGLPANVKGIIADCPYSAPKDIICHVMGNMRLPRRLLWPFIRLGAKLYGGFLIHEASAAEAVSGSDIPTLIFHGEADTLVPCEMSESIQEANIRRVKRYTFPDADHGLSFLVDSVRYRQLVTEFMDQIL